MQSQNWKTKPSQIERLRLMYPDLLALIGEGPEWGKYDGKRADGILHWSGIAGGDNNIDVNTRNRGYNNRDEIVDE